MTPFNAKLEPAMAMGDLNAGSHSMVTGTRPPTGDFGSLRVDFRPSTNVKDWSYSEATGKLYCARNKTITVRLLRQARDDKENVSTQSQSSPTTWLKMFLVYESNQHRSRPVARCALHRDQEGSSEAALDLSSSRVTSSSIRDHVLVCHNGRGVANHLKDFSSGRCYSTLPVDDLDEGAELDLSFGCLNTCLGHEYSLRLWTLVFSVEAGGGEVVGRTSVRVKVCAAPKRERLVEERAKMKNNHPDEKRARKSLDDRNNVQREEEAKSSSLPATPCALKVKEEETAEMASVVAVDSAEEMEMLTRIRDELRSSPCLKALLAEKLKPCCNK